ncbi:MAG: ABC transporter ATP-binding protein/permease [Actinobacteria bacterium]|nr:ABC transporter ATP-binding protein/permease [Actinomycetota bacterium]
MTDKGTSRALSTFLGLAFKADRWRIIKVLLIEIAFRSVSLATAVGLKVILDGIAQTDLRMIVVGAVLTAAPLGIQRWAGPAYIRVEVNLREKVQMEVEAELAAATADPVTIEHLESPKHLDEINLAAQQRGWIAHMMATLLSNVQGVLTLGGSLALLATIDPRVLFLPLFGIPAFFASRRAAALVEKANEANAERLRRRTHLFSIGTSAEAGKELRIFGLHDTLVNRYHRASEEVARETNRAAVRSGLVRVAGQLAFAVGYVGAVALIIDLAARGAATPGDVMMAVTLAAQVNGYVAGMAESGGTFARTVKSAKRFLGVLDYADAHRPKKTTVTVPATIRDGIVLEGVTFTYPDAAEPALKDVTVKLPAGSVVALVGENGAGKTTLVKLLFGMYEPSAGSISLDGVDLDDFDPTDWRAHTSAAFQDFVRFEFSIGESVGIGDLPRVQDESAVRSALHRAGAEELIKVGDDGLETPLGRTWANGIDLSGGQWQKLALARSLMRRNPLLLVFDEPTAALDAETEHALFERFAAASREEVSTGMITLLISHRFSTVRMADLIVVLNQGKVEDVGSHDDLVLRRGLYAELYALQAGAYE